ncbi:juvenile hormone esterase-like [Diorhabda sublineata]|uniref:juvenile hormone esterase-like n=1 Tax=Diorhabda sublineata TaxID=1163346 RepID=UPI0024E11A7E|nr:juvenile hormone esterase-like [Diorhabda sublineata]XP_056644898.1 juvenile hormone esterase-like [Diorhabda sublineata]
MESPVVTIAEGKLRGNQRTNLDGEAFYAFLGIPYGKPPVGNLRFKAPEPAEQWTGIRDATKQGSCSIHCSEITRKVDGAEDCLNLNVFSKQLPSEDSSLKPVMIWIHGGGFIIGSNNVQHYGPEHLMLEDIVLVTINYRLGFLGFLKVDDPSLEIPNNAGICDQRLAMQWVQKNIKYFNGDPNNVTIFGESAGGMSVHFHVLSQASKGLFHKAIMQSGCLFTKLESQSVVVKMAQLINKNAKTEREALEVLRKVPEEKFFELQTKFLEKFPRNKPFLVWEESSSTQTIPVEQKILSEQYNKVPLLAGFTNNEGILEDILYTTNVIGSGWEYFFEFSRSVGLKEDHPKRQIILDKLSKFYSQGKYASEKYMWTTDSLFIIPTVITSKLHAKTSSEPVYLYNMSLDAGLNFWKKLFDKNHYSGASHCDELGYLFNTAFAAHKLHKGQLEISAIRRFVKLWTNFAKYGNPTPTGNDLNITWKPVDKNEVHYLDIGEELVPCTNPIPDRFKVWSEVLELINASS